MSGAGRAVSVVPRRRATLIGGTAVLMWSTMALLTTLAGPVPPFQLTAMAFTVAFGLGLGKWVAAGEPIAAHLRWPVRVWLLGVGGLFAFHFFYFMALRNAPPVEASLIAYIWPLLLVVFSAFLPGERLRWWHGGGVVAGLAGTVLLVTDGGVAFTGAFWFGYAMAVACAVVWAGYSLLSRRVAHVSTNAVGGFCGATAVLALGAHLVFETTVWPVGGQWLAVLGIGLGPAGAAFYVWDHGVKHGDIRALGAMAYTAPLLSTVLLIAFGQGEASFVIAAACGLIVGGAGLASKDLWRPEVMNS